MNSNWRIMLAVSCRCSGRQMAKRDGPESIIFKRSWLPTCVTSISLPVPTWVALNFPFHRCLHALHLCTPSYTSVFFNSWVDHLLEIECPFNLRMTALFIYAHDSFLIYIERGSSKQIYLTHRWDPNRVRVDWGVRSMKEYSTHWSLAFWCNFTEDIHF